MKKSIVVCFVFCFGVFAFEDADSLDLLEWIVLANENSTLLTLASADVHSAEASYLASKAFLYPGIVFSSSVGYKWTSTPNLSDGFDYPDQQSRQFSLKASQEIFSFGGSSWLNISSSRHSLNAAEFTMQATSLSLVSSLVEAYYGVTKAIHMLDSAQRALDRSIEHFVIVENMCTSGNATELELLQAEIQINSDNLSLIQQETTLADAYALLYQTTGLNPDNCSFKVDPEAILQPLSLEEVENFAIDISGNFGIMASEENTVVSEYESSISERLYWPSLTASGGWCNGELDFDEFFRKGDWDVSLALNWTLFDGFNRESSIQLSRATLLHSMASHKALLNNTLISASTAKTNLVRSTRSWQITENLFELRSENLRLATEQYRLGNVPFQTLLDAHTALVSAESTVESSRTECLVGESKLSVLLGQLPRMATESRTRETE